jgi:hypothetical protein
MNWEQVMATQLSSCEELSTLITHNQHAIVSAWAKELFEMPQVRTSGLQIEELQAIADESLEGLLQSIALPGDSRAAKTYLLRLVNLMNSELAALIEAFWLFRKAAIQFIQPEPGDSNLTIINQLDNWISRITIQLSQSITGDLQQQVEKANRQTKLITEIARTVGSTLDLDQVLLRAGNAIAQAAGANHCFFYIINDEGEIELDIPADLRLLPNSYYTNVQIAKIQPILTKEDAVWQVLKEKKPVSIYDAQNDPRTTKGEGELHDDR